jgi:hypothetical protein
MRRVSGIAAAIAVGLCGIHCNGYYVYNPDVIGPHGEHAVELACKGGPDECLASARKYCGGDFDVIPPSVPGAVVVHCQVEARAPVPDAGS